MLRLRCDGDADEVHVEITSLDGIPMRLDRLGRPQPTRSIRCVVSRASTVVPLAAGRYRVTLAEPGYEPFEGTVEVPDGGDAALLVTANVPR
ncbi:MAG: PEGA domain-containing protein [Candidatus Saccharimonas sp.]|nr:PEGA domain-containing protein [Planctomycetaceae bacterium]